MNCVQRGRLSKFTHESKFLDRINTQALAAQAILEGDKLRESLKGKRIIFDRTDYELKNSFRL